MFSFLRLLSKATFTAVTHIVEIAIRARAREELPVIALRAVNHNTRSKWPASTLALVARMLPMALSAHHVSRIRNPICNPVAVWVVVLTRNDSQLAHALHSHQ
jgi:hypothetical protein